MALYCPAFFRAFLKINIYKKWLKSYDKYIRRISNNRH